MLVKNLFNKDEVVLSLSYSHIIFLFKYLVYLSKYEIKNITSMEFDKVKLQLRKQDGCLDLHLS